MLRIFDTLKPKRRPNSLRKRIKKCSTLEILSSDNEKENFNIKNELKQEILEISDTSSEEDMDYHFSTKKKNIKPIQDQKETKKKAKRLFKIKSQKAQKMKEFEKFLPLSNSKPNNKPMVKVCPYNGEIKIHIREIYSHKGKAIPTKKGVCLSVEDWDILMSMRDTIEGRIDECEEFLN